MACNPYLQILTQKWNKTYKRSVNHNRPGTIKIMANNNICKQMSVRKKNIGRANKDDAMQCYLFLF